MRYYTEYNSDKIISVCPNVKFKQEVSGLTCDMCIGSDWCCRCPFNAGIDTENRTVECTFNYREKE